MTELNIFANERVSGLPVNFSNADFIASDDNEDWVRFDAEYELGMTDIDCLHCLVEGQLAQADEALGWMNTPVMASYATLGEREDGMALQYDEAVLVFEHAQVPHLIRIALSEPTWLEHDEHAILHVSVWRSEGQGEHQAFFDHVSRTVHDLVATCLYWHGGLELEEESIRENGQVAVDALKTVVGDFVSEFNEQLPEGLTVSLSEAEELTEVHSQRTLH